MGLRNAIAIAQRSARRVAGTLVSYRRGNESCEITAIRGKTIVEQADHAGSRVKVATQDWLISVGDLVTATPMIGVPKVGDQIRATEGGQVLVYEVLPPQQGQPAYRNSDVYSLTWRVHTKHIATEPIE